MSWTDSDPVWFSVDILLTVRSTLMGAFHAESHPSAGPTRRQLIAGGAALAFLAACGGDDDGAGDAGRGGEVEGGDLSVVRFFGPFYAAGARARVPFGLSDAEGLLPLGSSPEQIEVRAIKDPTGAVIAENLTVPRYSDGLPRPYYVFHATPPVAGFYDMVLDVDGTEVVSQFEVVDADTPALVNRVDPGEVFPVMPTPTVDDDRGVTPICTREPACALHDTSLDELLGQRKIALMISTPGFCQISVCGPVLDILLGTVADNPDISFVHAEVYTDPESNDGQFTPDDFAPIVIETGLPYEPVLYTIDATGTVVDRLDYIFGEEEIRDVLADLATD